MDFAKLDSEKRKTATTEAIRIIAEYDMPINWHLKDILTEMCYHLGGEKVKGFKLMIKALANNDYMVASNEVLRSDWYDQQPEICERLARELSKL